MSGVLVTGATTPFGHGLVRALLAEESVGAVLAVAAESGWPFEKHSRLSYIKADLTKPRFIRSLLFGPARDLGIGTIVHSAHHRCARARGGSAHALHVESTRQMLHLAERHPTIEQFVYESSADVYRIDAEQPQLVGEDHPLELSPGMPQSVRDRVEADLTVCTRMGMSPLRIVVLRRAEILAPDSGSQLYDYLQSRICFRPLGYDPMLNVMSLEDAVSATMLALSKDSQGIFNVPGMDVLPLSAAIKAWGRTGAAVPGPLLGPIYAVRALARRYQFRYGLNRGRFHFSGVLDGTRARVELGYEPRHAIKWPVVTRVAHSIL